MQLPFTDLLSKETQVLGVCPLYYKIERYQDCHLPGGYINLRTRELPLRALHVPLAHYGFKRTDSSTENNKDWLRRRWQGNNAESVCWIQLQTTGLWGASLLAVAANDNSMWLEILSIG